MKGKANVPSCSIYRLPSRKRASGNPCVPNLPRHWTGTLRWTPLHTSSITTALCQHEAGPEATGFEGLVAVCSPVMSNCQWPEVTGRHEGGDERLLGVGIACCKVVARTRKLR